MHGLLARRPSPAMVVALIALFVAIGGGAYAATQLPKNSVGPAQLKKGAVTPVKLSPSSKTALTGATGATGAPGSPGAKGDAGPKGDAGQQGPGTTTLTYDAVASGSPSQVVVGTILGDTFYAECSIPAAGEARLSVYLSTSDGSLKWDYGTETLDNGTESARANSIDVPPGTITSPLVVAEVTAEGGGKKSDHNSEAVQLSPVRGYLNVHTAATTSTSPPAQTCHFSVMGFPSG
jgi:hypothetical protein